MQISATRLLDALLESTGDSIYFKDAECRLTRVSRKMLDDLGLEDEREIMGKTDTDLFGQEFGLKTEADDRRVMETGEPLQGMIEHRASAISGRGTNWTSTTKMPLRDEKGDIIGLVGITREINELKEAERALESALEQWRREVRTTVQIAQEIAAAPTLEDLYDRVVTLVRRRLGYDHVQLFRCSPDRRELVGVAASGEMAASLLEQKVIPWDTGILGCAAAAGQPILVPDLDRDIRFDVHPTGCGSKGELAVPITLHGQVLGVLDVCSDTIESLAEQDQILLESLCGQIATAINAIRLLDETETARRDAETLYRVGQHLTQSRDVHQVFEQVLTELLGNLGLPQGGVMIFDQAQAFGVFTVLISKGKVIETGLSIPIEGSPRCQQLIATREPVITRDVLENPGNAVRQVAEVLEYRSMLMAPIMIHGKIVGALDAESIEKVHDFSRREVALVQAVADQLGIAMENWQLLEETRAALAEVEAAHRAYVRRGWQEHLSQQEMLGRSAFIRHQDGTVLPAADVWHPEMERALATLGPAAVSERTPDGERTGMAIPIRVRGQTIGVLGVEAPESNRHWTQGEIALLESVGDQLGQTLETARLFADTQRRAERERLVGEITARVRATTDVQAILATAAEELGRALGASYSAVRVGLRADSTDDDPSGSLTPQHGLPDPAKQSTLDEREH